jgi:hypothetical protein
MIEQAFGAVYADWKVLKTRSVVQVVLELPIKDSDEAYRILGGMPTFDGQPRYFAVARLDMDKVREGVASKAADQPTEQGGDACRHTGITEQAQESPSPTHIDLVKRAVVLSNDPDFRMFLKANYNFPLAKNDKEGADQLRFMCAVESRKDIKPGSKAEKLLMDLDEEFRKWLLGANVEQELTF